MFVRLYLQAVLILLDYRTTQSICLNSSGGFVLSGSLQVYMPSTPSFLLFIEEIQ